MDHVQQVAESVSLMYSYGYHSSANEYAAIHMLNNASMYRGRKRKRIIEDSLVDLVAAKAVFDVSSTYSICLDALKAIDNAAKDGVELSVQDALEELL